MRAGEWGWNTESHLSFITSVFRISGINTSHLSVCLEDWTDYVHGYEGLSSLVCLTASWPASAIIHIHPPTAHHSSSAVIKYHQACCIGTSNDAVCSDTLTLFTSISSNLTFASVLSDILLHIYLYMSVSPLIYWWPLVRLRHLKDSCQYLTQTSQRDCQGSGCLSGTR